MSAIKMSNRATIAALALLGLTGMVDPAFGQVAPEIGYVYPSGGRAGTTVDVKIGGYDWTTDIQLFVHDPRIKLEILGPPGDVLVPPPPYWFGAKGRGPAWPLPREFPARLTIPADVPPGLVRFQAANANGASSVGLFHVSDLPEIAEDPYRKTPQRLADLPVIVSGQIGLIEEVDQYDFFAPQSGPITIELISRRMGSPLHGLIQVRDEERRAIVDVADTEGNDLTATFTARAGAKYTLSLHDLDFAGDKSYVYRLAIVPGPHVVAAYPAAGRRGSTQPIDFIGVGIASGAERLETLTRNVMVPAAAGIGKFTYVLDAPAGPARPIELLISDVPETTEAPGASRTIISQLPCAVTGNMESRFGADHFILPLVKGVPWRIEAQAHEIGSPLDPELVLLGPDGKEIAANDDQPGTTSAQLFVTATTDGPHTLIITDRSGKSGGRDANYRLVIERARHDFMISGPSQLAAPLGGKFKLALKAVRVGGFKGPVQVSLTDLPPEVSAPAEIMIPEGKTEVVVELSCAADAPAAASLATLSAMARIGDQTVTRTAAPILLATTMKPRIKITPEGLDDVRKVHRGSTYLAPLLIERLEGYEGPITLEMTARQQRHRQGLSSREFVVPPASTRVEYPIFVPEWMETTKTSRMILNGVVQVSDPMGNVRSLVQRMEMRIGILPEGALLKIASPVGEISVKPGEEIRLPLIVSRAPELNEAVIVELLADASQTMLFSAEPVRFSVSDREGTLAVRLANDAPCHGDLSLTVRATALQKGSGPVVSETTVVVTVKSKP
jgi:hypothetical protein